MSRFIKFIPSDESSYLRKNHPNAFLLLSLIAERARRIPNQADGLEIGESHIGDYEEAGIETEMKYRTAKKILEMRGHIKISETCRTRKKSTTGITTKGTLIKLLRSDVWDINSYRDIDRNNDRITTEQRPDNDEQERIRKNKNEKTTPPNPQKGACVAVLYDCLKENKELTDDEKEILMQYEEKRVKEALDYAKQVKPNTTLIQMLRWHCSQKNAPSLPEKKKTDQQKLAFEFNAFLLSVGQELMHEQNKTLILEGQIITPQGSISLNNPISVLRADFEQIKRDYRKRKYG